MTGTTYGGGGGGASDIRVGGTALGGVSLLAVVYADAVPSRVQDLSGEFVGGQNGFDLWRLVGLCLWHHGGGE